VRPRSRQPDVDPRVADASLNRLRGFRVREGRDLSLSDLAAKAREYQRASRSLGAVSPAWEQACPKDLLPKTSIVSLARGVLTVGVDGSSTRYALDRAMRAGGLQTLRAASKAAITKVKLVERAG
jgi:hypothetical protein